MSRSVRPEVRTLTLANGDQLTVRARLTAGERRAHYARMFEAGADGRMQAIPFMNGIAVVLAYLLDWTLTDDAGRLVEIRDLGPAELMRVLDSLDVESFAEIRETIEAHEAAMNLERAEQKKTAGTMASERT